ncbi:FxLYD domain-containing protein [Halalkalicoccus subterraneus]|uniref:FxLYD domain-containing protein n=1 Tax=Halalkalicoccus subterraneus TaxID=2675002 RepID=UPI000EFBA2AA|nr:FxLYD domain-containing protein [Halalkalicoccus subterraneus]
MAVTGATTWLFTRDNDGTENGSPSNSERDQNETGNDTAERGEAPQASKEDVGNQSEHPEAANPEPEPQGPETNESAINESAPDTTPTAEDVTVSNTELVTESDTATVTGVATNEADEPVTVELEVQFLQEGEQLDRAALGGTTGLQPGDEWNFSITARGSGVSEATDYEISKNVRVAS